ncbi:MAG: hypothetical protein IPF87_18280 [Gemmatimonadetes bacterium]|nr:hypothetical protein [Gemmatimonadota bacterium]
MTDLMRRGAGDPTRDTTLRQLLQQLHADAAPPSEAFVARIRATTRLALVRRQAATIPLRAPRRQAAVMAFRVGFAAAMAVAIFALRQPLPRPLSSDELLLAAAIGAVTPDTQRLWAADEPLGIALPRATSDHLR